MSETNLFRKSNEYLFFDSLRTTGGTVTDADGNEVLEYEATFSNGGVKLTLPVPEAIAADLIKSDSVHVYAFAVNLGGVE